MNAGAGLMIGLLWASSIAGSYFYGHTAGVNSEVNRQVEIKQAIEETRDKAQQGAAIEIAKIKIERTTVQGKLTTVVRESPVYVDCKHTDDGLRLINQALTGED